jgi:heparan-alpha-glucosaminide N-acetyltransferase
MSLLNNGSLPIKKRIDSLDMTRGLIVLLSVFLSSLPAAVYEFAQHAEWYGVTLIDFIFPGFLTVFGVSLAIAYQKRVRWKRQFKVAVKLILFGLVFNMVMAWSLDFSTLRFTGVLQMYSVLGIIGAVIIYYIKSPVKLTILGVLVMGIYSVILLFMGGACEGGLIEPFCNPSWTIDKVVFGESHIYSQGTRGFDPEGIPIIIGALGNIIFGLGAGRLLIQRNRTGFNPRLILHGIFLILLAFLLSSILPFGKKMWTPSFSLLTAGVTSLVLAFFHTFFDRHPVSDIGKVISEKITWFLVAFGRNSFLIYFGKYVLISLLLNISIQKNGQWTSIYQTIYGWIEKISFHPPITYTFLMVGFWTLVALILNKYKVYVKV